jgi:hypothetical protein
MTQAILRRLFFSPDGTFGQLELGGVILCKTVERPWLDNKRLVSCIPTGDYKVVKRTSPKYGHHWHIKGVPNRSLILFHNANYPSELQGCVGVGRNYMIGGKETVGVTESRATMDYLREVLPDSFDLWVRGK